MNREFFMQVAMVVAILSCNTQLQTSSFKPSPGSPFAVGSRPADVVLGDVNNDGRLDIITANAGSNDVTVLLGKANGGFTSAPGSPFSTGKVPRLLALGDLNQNGNLDIALTYHNSNEVMILMGNGKGGFVPAPDSPYAGLEDTKPHNHGLALGDVNGDGVLDIVTTNQEDNSISVLLNEGRGGFVPAQGSPFSVGRMPYLLALGDVNEDSNIDVVIPNAQDNNVTILLGNGRGSFNPAADSPYSVDSFPYNSTLGDFNGDQHLDLITTHNDSTLISILLGDGHGTFRKAPSSPFDLGQRGWKVRLGNINSDDNIDLMTGTAGNAVVVLLGDGDGGFKPMPGSPFSVGKGPWGIAIGDLNRDGKLDIVTSNSDNNNVTVLLGN